MNRLSHEETREILQSKSFSVVELVLSRRTARAKIDLDKLSAVLSVSLRWYAYWHKGANTHYVISEPKGQRVFLHRLVSDAPNGMVVDHIHHDGLDNRRSEIRVVSQSDNLRNRRKRSEIAKSRQCDARILDGAL